MLTRESFTTCLLSLQFKCFIRLFNSAMTFSVPLSTVITKMGNLGTYFFLLWNIIAICTSFGPWGALAVCQFPNYLTILSYLLRKKKEELSTSVFKIYRFSILINSCSPYPRAVDFKQIHQLTIDCFRVEWVFISIWKYNLFSK